MKNGRSGLNEGIPLSIKRQKIDDEWIVRQWISDLDTYLGLDETSPELTNEDDFNHVLYLVLDNCIKRFK